MKYVRVEVDRDVVRQNKTAADPDPATSKVPEEVLVEVPAELVTAQQAGQVMSDCMWCQYGKPAVAGAVAGGVLGYLTGVEPAKMALYGVGAGLAYGWYRG